jgi:hypothetical protein
MSREGVDRRRFLGGAGLLASFSPWITQPANAAQHTAAASPCATTAPLHWLPGHAPASFEGTTWGTPWPQGQARTDSDFVLRDATGQAQPLQSWVLATWPDGSIKWSAHALAPLNGLSPSSAYTLEPAPATRTAAAALPAEAGLRIQEQAEGWQIDTGAMRCSIARSGPHLISEVSCDGRVRLREGQLLLQIQNDPEAEHIDVQPFTGQIREIALEQRGPLRAVLAIRGIHVAGDGRERLPFVLRLYFYAGSAALRLMHTLVVDIDEAREFIKGVGLRFASPLDGALQDRHVRFIGADGGVFAEAVRGLTGLRRDVGEAVALAQIQGQATPPAEQLPPAVGKRLNYIPAFGSYRLLQAHPDGFSIEKRTGTGQGWLHAASGKRASGTGYLGTPQGGVAFGIRNFWQSYPAQLDIEDAHTDQARITLWLWAPSAPPMDLRFYHDGLGQTDFASQREALEITYEDYEPGFGRPLGVARSSELQLQFFKATPSTASLVRVAERIQEPPLLLASPEHLHAAGAFGPNWAPAASPALATPNRASREIEDQLAWYFHFYQQEVERRRWYGFWDYGDVMHSYDGHRHVWRYDVGGYAWDNSELSTDLWLWYYFLRSGRQDVFRMAEAMTRHTGEVDVHHLGPFAPLGSRHNVRHWGDSAKQLRISTVANRRFLYYLTADERIGELMREQVEALRTLQTIVPGRKIGQQASTTPGQASINFGTDWGAIAAAWLTAWERSSDPVERQQIRDRLRNSMRTIGSQPLGFFTGVADMDVASGNYAQSTRSTPSVSHLSAVFGLAEIAGELIQVLPEPAFEKAWLDYCRLYNASPGEQKVALGVSLSKLNLAQGHARLTAYAGYRLGDEALRRRAWKEFFAGQGGIAQPSQKLRHITAPAVLNAVEEVEAVSAIDKAAGSTAADNLSTNAVAQWALSAMALLALAGTPPEHAP